MNGVSLLLILATLGGTPVWRQTSESRQEDNQLEFCYQIDPLLLSQLEQGKPVGSMLPTDVPNLHRFCLRISAEKLAENTIAPSLPDLVAGAVAYDPQADADEPVIVIRESGVRTTAAGVTHGWETTPDGHTVYKIQLDPSIIRDLKEGDQLFTPLHYIESGPIRRFEISVGTKRLLKRASIQQLASTGNNTASSIYTDNIAATQPDYSTRYNQVSPLTPRQGSYVSPQTNLTSSRIGQQQNRAGQNNYVMRDENGSLYNDGSLANNQPSAYGNNYNDGTGYLQPSNVGQGYNSSQGFNSNSNLRPPQYPEYQSNIAGSNFNNYGTQARKPNQFNSGNGFANTGTSNFGANSPAELRTASIEKRANTVPGTTMRPPTSDQQRQVAYNDAVYNGNQPIVAVQPVDSKTQNWVMLCLFCSLCLSIGGNLYLGWTAAEFYSRYRTAVDRMRGGR